MSARNLTPHGVPYQAADRLAASHQLRVNDSQPRALKNTPGGRRFGPAQTCSDINVTENSADSCLMGAAMGDKRNLGKGTAMLADAMGRQERRRHPRFLFSASMTVRLQDGISMSGISVDMSTSGLSAMVSGALSEGGHGDDGAGGGRAGVGTCRPQAGAVVWI